jgi:hypothetical protein
MAIHDGDSIFFNKNQFTKFITSNFTQISETEIEEMWRISFNELRFKEQISMKAFVYNFSKFYL